MPTESEIIVYVKLPIPGKVKTRLARGSIGADGAATFYKACAERTAETASRCVEAACTVAHADQDRGQEVREWLGSFAKEATYVQQTQSPDLGQRMHDSLHDALHKGARKAVLIGSDCPDITPGVLTTALVVLESFDVVFGPALDGGYYLVGVSCLPHGLFEGITWSTETVLEANTARAEALGLRVAPMGALPRLRDIDTAEDLKEWLRSGTQGASHDPLAALGRQLLDAACC